MKDEEGVANSRVKKGFLDFTQREEKEEAT
jgi:hypothetical protein